jgi:SAM-dependent methyltransferase
VQTWHHGLVARWWAEFNAATLEELAYYRGAIERFGQPALDLGCGTGRILLPLLEAGLDVDGIDVSADMLAHCRHQAAARGLRPTLSAQPMHQLEPPRRYRTVYICDSFGIGGSRTDDVQALRRIHAALEPGGALVFSMDLPYANARDWSYWLPQERRKLPRSWPEAGDRRTTPDGDELELMSRLVDLDPRDQRITMSIRARQWRHDDLVAEEEHSLAINLYFEQELRLMLEAAGFVRVAVEGRYTGRKAEPDTTTIVVVAQGLTAAE